MYIYGTTEGGNNYTKLVKGGNARRFRYPVSLEDRKTMTPEEVSIYCLKYPPWARFPYGSVHPLKKKQNETIVKEEVSLGMLKIHSMTSPESMGDIISILLNLDGFLDDTMDVQGTESREDFSAAAVAFLETFLGKHVPKFVSWWLEFAKTSRAMIDDLHSKTPEKTKRKNMASVTEILRKNIPKPEEILGLINDSSYGTKIVEGN